MKERAQELIDIMYRCQLDVASIAKITGVRFETVKNAWLCPGHPQDVSWKAIAILREYERKVNGNEN